MGKITAADVAEIIVKGGLMMTCSDSYEAMEKLGYSVDDFRNSLPFFDEEIEEELDKHVGPEWDYNYDHSDASEFLEALGDCRNCKHVDCKYHI